MWPSRPRLCLAVWRRQAIVRRSRLLTDVGSQPGREHIARSRPAGRRPGYSPDFGGLPYDRRRQGRLRPVFCRPDAGFWWFSATTRSNSAPRPARRWGRRPIWSSGRRRPTSSREKAAPRSIFWRPQGLKASRLIVVGAGKLSAVKEHDFLKLGGAVAGKLRAGNEAVTVIAELPDGAHEPDQAAAIASGIRLRAYKFDRYKTKKKDGEDAALRADVSIAVGRCCAPRERPSRRTPTSSTASSSRATWSTSRRTCSFPWNSRVAPASCANSAWRSRFSTSRR